MSITKELKVPGQAANHVGQERVQTIFGKRPVGHPEGKGASTHFKVEPEGKEGGQPSVNPSVGKGVRSEEQYGVGKRP